MTGRIRHAEESKLLEDSLDAEIADERLEDESLRDSWFAQLRAGLGGGGESEGSAAPPAR